LLFVFFPPRRPSITHAPIIPIIAWEVGGIPSQYRRGAVKCKLRSAGCYVTTHLATECLTPAMRFWNTANATSHIATQTWGV
jgi:hypothetical protein